MGRWQEEAGSSHKGDRQGSRLCPCPARLLCPNPSGAQGQLLTSEGSQQCLRHGFLTFVKTTHSSFL